MVRNYYPTRLKRFNNSLLDTKLQFFTLKTHDGEGNPLLDAYGNQREVYVRWKEKFANMQLVPIEDKEIGASVYNKMKYKVIVRYDKELDDEKFFLYEGVMYRISYADDYYGEGRYLDCLGIRVIKNV